VSRKFLIPSLVAAGFGHTDPLQAALINAASTDTSDPNQAKLFQQYKQEHLYTLAQHRSHSSHSSHRSGGGSSGGHYSHTSHRSSTGGYSTPSYNPAPLYVPPSRPTTTETPSGSSSSSTSNQPLFTPPATSTPADGDFKTLTGRSTLFKTIVMHVQVALMGQGLFDGPIDGHVGPKTRAALRTFQQTHNLAVTGTITSLTLDALQVPSQ
jgi:His-Xaa-Ser repeat protein HxsA